MAEVWIPAPALQSILESGHPVTEAEQVKLLPAEEGSFVFETGSGEYSFAVERLV